MGIEGSQKKRGVPNAGVETPSRRRFLELGLAAVAGLALKGDQTTVDTSRERRSGRENFDESERFKMQTEGFKYQYRRLRRDEILFVDEFGAPLGEPVSLRDEAAGVTAGNINADGILEGRINQTWLDRQREMICHRYNAYDLLNLHEGLPLQLNVVSSIREALYSDPGKERLDPETFLDIVYYFGRQPVVGTPDKTRIEFVRQNAMRNAGLPENVRERLSFLIPGLAAQESKYNNATRSSVGAIGIMQFMPDTWRELGYTPEDSRSLAKQTEAVGKYFSDMHGYITRRASQSLEVIKREYFDGNIAEYEKHFLVPILLNSYNSGQGRIVKAVDLLVERYPRRAALEAHIGVHADGIGMDAYRAMTISARSVEGENEGVPGYGRDSSEYVARIHALAELLEDE
ncbi:MAG TPA: lytic transglycosylase domain-containing protein [Candidatus Paceibacterota bacterium]|jgi:hypothetical protein